MIYIKKFVIKALKKIYRLIPIKQERKQKIKNKLASKFKFLKKISEQSRFDYNVNSASDILFKDTEELKKIDKKIAVHLHLYYIDLSDEFIGYLKNIPYKFDLLISVSEGVNLKEIEDKFKKELSHVNNVIVKHTKNIGRDFSPMFIVFKNDILKYDYLLHMHTKKSIRTGQVQDGWRNHMLEGVLGSEKLVMKIFTHFESDNKIGLIYPETYYDMPYWAHTWLKNRSMCNEIANKLNFSLSDKYIDYSVGSFFWTNVKAISKFLNLNYKWDDFGKEEGKADGTLAHAIERMIPQIVLNSGYSYYVVDNEKKVFRSKGLKNLYQYSNKNKGECLKTLMNYDIITFDIFDTLITRKIYSPSKVYNELEIIVKDKYKLDNFKKIREDAEYNVRVDKNFKDDVTLTEIYKKISDILSINLELSNEIKNIEIDLELKYTYPREDMLSVYNELLKNKKEIILISDMYLTSDIINKMLEKCGYKNYSKLLVSSETNKRKDNGEIWNYYFDNIAKDKSSIHVGDNEQSDVQQLCDIGKPFYHVMQPVKMYNILSQYDYIKSSVKTIGDNQALGLIINKKLFNSPFNLRKSLIENYEEFGYAIFGPIFFNYFSFLETNALKNKNDKLLFLAREGYYFEPLYKEFCKIFNAKEINHEYLLTSRRASSVANIETVDDAFKIISSNYEGRMNNLFKVRLGIDDNSIPDKKIALSNEKDREEVYNVLKELFPKYSNDFKTEKENYLKYLNKIIKKSKNTAVVDLGYSGTIQYYLMKLLNVKMDGYYFTLNDKVKPAELGGKCYGCYDNKKNIEKYVFLFSMIMETFLTAPFGQLIKMDKNGNPIYKDEAIDSSLFERLDDIKKGIIEFMKDLSELNSNYQDINISNEFACSLLASTIYAGDTISEEIKKMFVLENSYSLDSSINVFDFLYNVYVKNQK